MKLKKKELLITLGSIFILIGIAFFVFSQNNSSSQQRNNSLPLTPSQDTCSSDADCVPSSCCHATSCTTKAQAPNCKGALCSQVCTPGTLDCGQAHCGCVNKKCQVVPQ